MHRKKSFNEALREIADDINIKYRHTLLHYLNDTTEFTKYIQDNKQAETFVKGNKTKTMHKVASMPTEVDEFFTRIYGENYYKDPKFFERIAPEWKVIK